MSISAGTPFGYCLSQIFSTTLLLAATRAARRAALRPARSTGFRSGICSRRRAALAWGLASGRKSYTSCRAPARPAAHATRRRRNAAGRRGTAQIRCRISRPRRPDRHRRRCARPAPPSPPPPTGPPGDPPVPAGTAPARILLRLAVDPRVEAAPGLAAEVACASTSSVNRRGGAASPPSILPTSTQMSRPTVSASSIGPIGMPNASAASSTVSGAMPSSTARIAAIRYGASTRLTRNPGALFTGSGSLSIWRTNAAACGTRTSPRLPADHDLDQHHLRDRIEEMQADEPRRIGERTRDLLERNARRIGRQDRLGLRLLLERREQRPLGVDVLEDRLDDDVGARDAVTRHVRNQPIVRVAHAARIAQPVGEELARALHRRRQALAHSGPAA